MFIPKKSKYLHLSSVAYKGRKHLSYYVRYFHKTTAKYLLLEILNTTTFTDEEIISFCAKCKEKGLEVKDICWGMNKYCESSLHYAAVDKFINIIITKWNVK